MFFFSDSAVFGAPLEVAIQRSTLGTDQLELPTVFRQCIDYLEENGKWSTWDLDLLSILSGASAHLHRLECSFV